MGSGIKRVYYADPLRNELDAEYDEDVNELLYESLDPQADLEEVYERAQNAYFATRYREGTGLGFLGTMSSQRKKSEECNDCGSTFPSNNKLHDHLRVLCLQGSERNTGEV